MQPISMSHDLASLPVRLTAFRDPIKHTYRARWEDGEPVCEAVLSLGKNFPKKTRLEATGRFSETDRKVLEWLGGFLEKEVFPLLQKSPFKAISGGLTQSQKSIPITFFKEFRTPIGVSPDWENGRTESLCLDLDTVRKAAGEPGALTDLMAACSVYSFARLANFSQRRSLHFFLDFVIGLPEERRSALQELLQEEWVDSGDVVGLMLRSVFSGAVSMEIEQKDFSSFNDIRTETLLDPKKAEKAGVSKKKAEATVRWRDRWISWTIGQSRLDLPYDARRVFDLLETPMEDVDAKRALINEAIVRSYSPEAEGANIERISAFTLENNTRLVSGRLSRAFGNQANLLSAAKMLRNPGELLGSLSRLEKTAKGVLALETQVSRLAGLVRSGGEVPFAQVVGAVDSAEEALIEYTRELMKKNLQARAGAISDEVFAGKRSARRVDEKTLDALEDIRKALDRLREDVDEAAKRDAAYVLFLQRHHPIETIGLANANSCRDVHPGKEEDLRDLIRLGTHNIYSTPGNGTANGEPVHWISRVEDWVEAIPLFIKEQVVKRKMMAHGEEIEVEAIETAVDQEAMEAFFRMHAEYWAQNIDRVADSMHVGLARKLLSELANVEGGAEGLRALARNHESTARSIAALGGILETLYRDNLAAIHLVVETEGIERIVALERFAKTETSSPLRSMLNRTRKAIPREAALLSLAEKWGKQEAVKESAARLRPLAHVKTRRTPSLHILTTESAGMTESYVQSWLEEEMALFKTLRTHGLEAAVATRQKEFSKRILTLGRHVLRQYSMDVVVDEISAAQRLSEPAAVMEALRSYLPVAEETARLAVLIEYEERKAGTRDVERTSEPEMVERILEKERSRFEEEAAQAVLKNYGLVIEERIREILSLSPELDRSTALRRAIESEADYWDEWESHVLSAARRTAIVEIDRMEPGARLAERARTYLRERTMLSRSTARKQVLAEAGLQGETLDPRHAYQAIGPMKRYNLLYTPSRVNLGENERDSVVRWRQWVGGADEAAARHGFEFYSLVNEGGVEERPALAYAEIQKTSENALCVTHFAGSNALGLLVNSVGEGDVEDMADQMNLRGDRMVLPAGEGYGGYCVPKDGLFLAFVLSLRNEVKLRQMGIPEYAHEAVMVLARECLEARERFNSVMDWQDWAGRHLLWEESLSRFFDVASDRVIFQVTKVARAVERFGEPWSEVADGSTLIQNLAARWGVERMIIDAEQVNRFMTFHKAWTIYDALDEARAHHPAVPAEDRARVALSAEYKPVQDVRFSTGMRLFEMLARTGEHLTWCLSEEAQDIVHLMLSGFHPDSEDPKDKRCVRTVCEKLSISPDDAEAMRRLEKAFPYRRPPGDLVMSSVTMASTHDMLYYVSDTRLDPIANSVQTLLSDVGLSIEQIAANCIAHGGRLERWAGIHNLPEEKRKEVLTRIEGNVHALVLRERGPGRDYAKDLQGADVVNAGIPFPQLIELLKDAPRLIHLMRTGNPHSALAITDGTAGRAHRCMLPRDVMAFFAACEKIGRRGVYRAVGLGRQNVERLRVEMSRLRERATRLYEALAAVAEAGERDLAASAKKALGVYAEIVAEVRGRDEAILAVREEEKVKRYHKWTEAQAFVTRGLQKLSQGLPLAHLDVGTWLSGLGGTFAVIGEERAEIEKRFEIVRSAVKRIREWEKENDSVSDLPSGCKPFGKEEERRLVELLVRPRFVPEIQGFVQEKLVETSSKAVEVAAVEALERRKALRLRAERARALQEREAGFQNVFSLSSKGKFEKHEEKARLCLNRIAEAIHGLRKEGLSLNETSEKRTACNTAFGEFLAYSRFALESLAEEIAGKQGRESRHWRPELGRAIAELYTGREVILENWKALAGGYEDIGPLARLAEAMAPDRDSLERFSRATELFYIAFALGQTLEFALVDRDSVDLPLFWKRLMDFFAETINDHTYPYTPWTYSRGTAFSGYSEQDLYELATARHRWLYAYLREVLVTRTELAEMDPGRREFLVGNFLEGNRVVPIGSGAANPVEQEWRAYNHLRELAFQRGDGFAFPPVFENLDPAIIEADTRVNLVFLYPVGRTHISRAFREGPTLCRELQESGAPGSNLLVSRYGELHPVSGSDQRGLFIYDAHLYLSEEEFRKALIECRGLSDEAANRTLEEERSKGRLTPKGVRIAARFMKNGEPAPVLTGSVIPFHGHPLYEAGVLEDIGLPATVQSLIYTDITYDKSLYPEIYDAESGVDMPAEIDWPHAGTKGRSEADVKKDIENGLPSRGYPGLRAFVKDHPLVLIKGAAESGARNLKVFDFSGKDPKQADLSEAVDFIYTVSKKQNVVIQEAVRTSPEFWASEKLMNLFVDRQILEWHRPVERESHPRSQIFGSLRIVAVASHPNEPYETAFPIVLCSLQVATNVGRGGTLDVLLPEYIREEFREIIQTGLRNEAPKVMKACARFAEKYSETYRKTRGREIGTDLRGVSYAWPPYLMHDYLASPVFERPGRLVDVEPVYDETGNRIGSRIVLEDEEGRFEGQIRDWRFIHLEPNVGIGLWDRYNLREEEHERRRACLNHDRMDWDRIGQSDRIVLRKFIEAGAEYLEGLLKG